MYRYDWETLGTTPEECVEKGAWLLDNYGPIGWRSEIDLGDLEMESLHFCVLGQLYGSFQTGQFALMHNSGATEEKSVFAVTHGFDADEDPEHPDSEGNAFQRLRDLWRAELS